MPGLRVAVASGNWSNPATWDFGLPPGPGDIVASNGFTVNIDQDINVDVLTNTAQSTTGNTATMTSDTTPTGYVAAASSVATSGTEAFRAFRRDGNSSVWRSATTNTAWISYQFPTSIAINRYSIQGGTTAARCPNTWTFEGWNGTSWVVLHTVVNSSVPQSGFYNSPIIGNTTAYTLYRINVTATATGGNLVEISEIYLYELNYTTLSGAAGGGFTCSSSNTITLTRVDTSTGCLIGASVLSWTGAAGITTNLNVTTIREYGDTLLVQGSGTLNFTGVINNTLSNTFIGVINITGNCVFNIVGTLNPLSNSNQPEGTQLIRVSSAATINITGDIISTSSAGCCIRVSSANAAINITGNLSNTANLGLNGNLIIISAVCTINITGNCTGRVLNSASAGYLKIIGSIAASNFNGQVSVVSTNSNAINIFSGPFISATYGAFPYSVTRMHLIPILNNYFEFRDNSTNGALSPGAIAPASRMVSADTIIDAPLASNVRFGVSYGNGAYTGTCRIPSPSNVSLNVPFDTGSTGTAFLSSTDIASVGNSIWNIPVANLTGSNTIGERMANSSTVDTMGNQLASLL